MTAARKSANRFSKTVRNWHRRLGIVTGIWLLLLLATGVIINHTDGLHLAKQKVQQGWLLDHYGIAAPQHVREMHRATALWASDDTLWQGNTPLWQNRAGIQSAVWFAPMIIVLANNELLLLNERGQLQDRLTAELGLPAQPQQLAVFDNTLWLRTATGDYLADADLMTWQPASAAEPWPQPQLSQNPHRLALARSQQLNWERVLLDLHSGRLFGSWAIWLWDLLALALTLLIVGGYWLWFKHRR